RFTVDLEIGSDANDAGGGDLSLLVRLGSGSVYRYPLPKETDKYKSGGSYQWTIDPSQTIDPATIDGVGLGYVGGTFDGEVEVAVLTVKYATTTSSALTTLFSSTINHRFNKGDDWIRPVTVAGSGTGDTGGDTPAADPCEEDRCCADRLIRHLNANLGYY